MTATASRRETGGAPSVGSLGLAALLAALAVLFAASILTAWYYRAESSAWGDQLPPVPRVLWASTLALALTSYGLEKARRRMKRFVELGAEAPPRGPVARSVDVYVRLATIALIAFLAGQALAWVELRRGQVTTGGRLTFYEFGFYFLTGLHLAHVFGGLVYHAIALGRLREALTGEAGNDDGVRRSALRMLGYDAVYWHFLFGVWLVLFANLYLTRVPDPSRSFLSPLSIGLVLATLAVILAETLWTVRRLWRSGQRSLALFALVPPVAFVFFWAHADAWSAERRLARWTLAWLLFLAFLMLAIAIHADRIFPPVERTA